MKMGLKTKLSWDISMCEWLEVIALANHDMSETFNLWGAVQSSEFSIMRCNAASQSQRFTSMFLMNSCKHSCTCDFLSLAWFDISLWWCMCLMILATDVCANNFIHPLLYFVLLWNNQLSKFGVLTLFCEQISWFFLEFLYIIVVFVNKLYKLVLETKKK